jgi:hypothetical protein
MPVSRTARDRYMSLEARVIRKMRMTGLPEQEATDLVLAECADLEKRLGRSPLSYPKVPVKIDSRTEGPVVVAEKMRHLYNQDLYIHQRKKVMMRVMFVAAWVILATGVLFAATSAEGAIDPRLEIPAGCTVENVALICP